MPQNHSSGLQQPSCVQRIALGEPYISFVNEYIPADDMEKYQIKEIDKKFVIGGTNARDWTIDRDRDIYIRNVANGREDIRHQTTWTMYWNGDLLEMRLDSLRGGGQRGGPGWSQWKLYGLETRCLPEHLKSQRHEILDALREALLAYKDGGVFASSTTYEVILDIAEDA